MCKTCIHSLKMTLNSKLNCNCPKSEYFREEVSSENICDHYTATTDTACAFMREDGKCNILTSQSCQCRFYKTKAKLAAERQKSKARLRSLPATQQEYIKEQYNIKF